MKREATIEKAWALSAVIAGVLAGGGLASAQTATAPVADTALGEVTVTARRREETLLEVPLSISAVSAENIEARGIKDMVALSDYTPGFHFNNENLGRNDRGFTTFTFRGMDAGTFLVTRQPAQAFMDGIPIVGGSIPGLEDVERVEVIKGPQSAYFGRSTFSGAINFITKDPSYEWGARVKADLASYDTKDTSLMVEGPLVAEKAAFRLTGRYYDTGGQYANAAQPGDRLGARNTKSASVTFLIEPVERLRVKVYGGIWRDVDGPGADAITGSAERNCDPLKVGQPTYVCGSVPFRLTNAQIGKVAYVDELFRQTIIENGANLAQVFTENFIDEPGLERHAKQATLAVGYELANGIALDFSGGWNVNDFQTIPGNFVVSSARTPNSLYPRVPRVRQYAEQNMSLIDQGNAAFGMEARVTSRADQRFRWMVGASMYSQEAQGRSRGEANTATGYNDGALITDRDVRTTGVFTGLAYDVTERVTLNVEGVTSGTTSVRR
jgi:iron complex outermembrane receptor protein